MGTCLTSYTNPPYFYYFIGGSGNCRINPTFDRTPCTALCPSIGGIVQTSEPFKGICKISAASPYC